MCWGWWTSESGTRGVPWRGFSVTGSQEPPRAVLAGPGRVGPRREEHFQLSVGGADVRAYSAPSDPFQGV